MGMMLMPKVTQLVSGEAPAHSRDFLRDSPLHPFPKQLSRGWKQARNLPAQKSEVPPDLPSLSPASKTEDQTR